MKVFFSIPYYSKQSSTTKGGNPIYGTVPFLQRQGCLLLAIALAAERGEELCHLSFHGSTVLIRKWMMFSKVYKKCPNI